MNYHWNYGTVFESEEKVLGGSTTVETESGIKLRMKVNTDPYLDTPDLKIGDRVVVSWISPKEYPRSYRGSMYVDSDAVEKIDKWSRLSSYKRKHIKDTLSMPFRTEAYLIQYLQESGIRAEPATDFEDERLGIDLWVFLKADQFDLGVGWQWIPVDVTLRSDLSPYDKGSKYNTCFQRGVIAYGARDSNRIKMVRYFFSSVEHASKDMNACGRKLSNRNTALELELKQFPIPEIK